MSEAKKDFLAIFLIGCGSSFGRADTAEKAVALCKRSAEQDWKSLFDLDGREVTINVYDVTGYDDLFWDERGVHPDNKPEETLGKDRHSLVKVTLKVPSKHRRKRKVK